MTVLHFLSSIDLAILKFFNVDFASPQADAMWKILTHLDRQWWALWILLPLILLRLTYIYKMGVVKPLIAVLLAVGISDVVAYRGIKSLVNRPRPFQNLEIQSWLRHVDDAYGPSFPSNHAANCFAAAVVLAWFFPSRRKSFYIFATLVGVSRVALGVHYPSDVVAGAMLGILVGFLIRTLLLNRREWFWLRNSVSKSDANYRPWRSRFSRSGEC